VVVGQLRGAALVGVVRVDSAEAAGQGGGCRVVLAALRALCQVGAQQPGGPLADLPIHQRLELGPDRQA